MHHEKCWCASCEGYTYNMGIAKMQADRSCASTVVTVLGYISGLTLSI